MGEAVWHRLSKIFYLKNLWDGCSVFHCLTKWSSDISSPVSLAAYTCWNIWLERNRVIFEDCIPSPRAVVYRIAVSFTWQPSTVISIPNRVCEITFLDGFTLACFDGAALQTGNCCSAGGIFKSHASRVTKWYLNCGVGTNTKAELLGL